MFECLNQVYYTSHDTFFSPMRCVTKTLHPSAPAPPSPFSLLCGCVALQFDATLDVLSSAIVLWRYSNAAAVHSAHREYM